MTWRPTGAKPLSEPMMIRRSWDRLIFMIWTHIHGKMVLILRRGSLAKLLPTSSPQLPPRQASWRPRRRQMKYARGAVRRPCGNGKHGIQFGLVRVWCWMMTGNEMDAGQAKGGMKTHGVRGAQGPPSRQVRPTGPGSSTNNIRHGDRDVALCATTKGLLRNRWFWCVWTLLCGWSVDKLRYGGVVLLICRNTQLGFIRSRWFWGNSNCFILWWLHWNWCQLCRH